MLDRTQRFGPNVQMSTAGGAHQNLPGPRAGFGAAPAPPVDPRGTDLEPDPSDPLTDSQVFWFRFWFRRTSGS